MGGRQGGRAGGTEEGLPGSHTHLQARRRGLQGRQGGRARGSAGEGQQLAVRERGLQEGQRLTACCKTDYGETSADLVVSLTSRHRTYTSFSHARFFCCAISQSQRRTRTSFAKAHFLLARRYCTVPASRLRVSVQRLASADITVRGAQHFKKMSV